MTLVELLAVIGIIVLVAALAIPGVRMLTSDMKVREAGRGLQSFMQQVHSDAKLNGGAGFWIERDITAPNTGVAVYRVRRPPAFTGDRLDSVCTIINDPTGAITGAPGVFADFNQTLNPSVQALVTNWLDPTRNITRPQIRFDFKGRTYEITAGAVSGPSFRVQLGVLNHDTGGMPAGTYPNQKFSIIPPPVKLSTRAFLLPTETYIDLALSGFTPLDFDGDSQADTSGTELAVNSGDAAPGPVIVLFGPDGSIDRVISKNLAGGFPSGQTLFLYVVQDLRKETGEFNVTLDVTNYPGYGAAGTSLYANVDNLTNLWLTFGRNGQVTLSENSDATDRATNGIGDVMWGARSVAINQDQIQNN